MGRLLSGLGLVMLLVVMVIVMLLTARAWRQVTPHAIDVTNPAPTEAPASHPPADRPELIEGTGPLPNLNEMRYHTAAHTDRLKELEQQIDE